MFKITLEDFLEEVKGELYSYGEIEEADIISWEENFMKLFDSRKLKTIEVSGGNLTFKDETEIFQIADGYYVAILNDDVTEYWECI